MEDSPCDAPRRRVLVLLAAVVALGLAVARRRRQAPAPRSRSACSSSPPSAPIFVGVEKGFFKEFGVEPELVYFQAAAPIATALAAGQLDVGATGLTAALYNIVLGGEKLWIVADKGREWPGYPLVAIVVQKELWDGRAPVRSRISRASASASPSSAPRSTTTSATSSRRTGSRWPT